MTQTHTVNLHGSDWKLSDVEENASYWSKESLRKERYHARDALVDNAGNSRPYSGRHFDEKKFKVVKHGWSHDHCEICFWALRESEDEEEGVGYTDGCGNWVCLECFDKLIKPKIEQGRGANALPRAAHD